jgi:hypothetical protein
MRKKMWGVTEHLSSLRIAFCTGQSTSNQISAWGLRLEGGVGLSCSQNCQFVTKAVSLAYL